MNSEIKRTRNCNARLFAFVHRGAGEHRSLLFVDQNENIAASLDGGHRLWADALRLGFNELNVGTPMGERVDRLLLSAHVIRRCSPLLNVIEAGPQVNKARPFISRSAAAS